MYEERSAAELKTRIRDHYAEAAVTASQTRTCGCSCGCGPAADSSQATIGQALYSSEETSGLPSEAVLASLGCGNPTALAELGPGEVVLDLGSGGGIDVLLSAQRVGPTGRVYGLDMTDEMLALARQNQARAGVENAEFLKGELEDIPLPNASVDVIISNCVVNLSTDKDRALAEAYRVLKPGGRLAISDVLFQGDMSLVPKDLLGDPGAWSACITGALEERDFVERLGCAGFVEASVEVVNVYDGSPGNNMCGAPPMPDGLQLVSGFVRARKPREAGSSPVVDGQKETNVTAVRVFDPPMCCSTGVCGPSVDPQLVRFAADLDWLRNQGVAVERFNLAQEPGAFAEDAAVRAALEQDGETALPLVKVGDEIKSAGVYPSRDELAKWAGLQAAEPSIVTDAVAELVAIGAAIASNCEPCFKYHYDMARKLGVSHDDMWAAVTLAQNVKDAPAKAVLDLAGRYLRQGASPAEVTTGGGCC